MATVNAVNTATAAQSGAATPATCDTGFGALLQALAGDPSASTAGESIAALNTTALPVTNFAAATLIQTTTTSDSNFGAAAPAGSTSWTLAALAPTKGIATASSGATTRVTHDDQDNKDTAADTTTGNSADTKASDAVTGLFAFWQLQMAPMATTPQSVSQTATQQQTTQPITPTAPQQDSTAPIIAAANTTAPVTVATAGAAIANNPATSDKSDPSATKPTEASQTDPTAPGQTVVNQTDQSVASQFVAKQSVANQTAADQSVANQTMASQFVANRSVANQTTASQSVANRSVANQTAASQSVANQSVANQTPASQADQTASDLDTSDQTMASQTTASQTVANAVASDQAVSNQPVTNQTTPVAVDPATAATAVRDKMAALTAAQALATPRGTETGTADLKLKATQRASDDGKMSGDKSKTVASDKTGADKTTSVATVDTVAGLKNSPIQPLQDGQTQDGQALKNSSPSATVVQTAPVSQPAVKADAGAGAAQTVTVSPLASETPKVTADLQVTAGRHSDDTSATLDKLGITIAAKSLQGLHQFDIRLDPPDLGRVQVKLTVDDSGQAQASLVVDKPHTLDLLQRDSSSLNRALTDAGLNLSNSGLSFSLRDQQQQADGGTNKGRSRSLSAKAALAADSSTIRSTSGSYAPNSVRLDIRV